MKDELRKWNELIKRQDGFYHRSAKGCSLADAQFWVLYALCEKSGSLCQNSFCENWSYSKQTVNTAVARLEKSGLVRLSFSEGSRKKKDIFLTPAGEKFCLIHIRPLQEKEERAMCSLAPEERKEFLRLYEKLLTALET